MSPSPNPDSHGATNGLNRGVAKQPPSAPAKEEPLFDCWVLGSLAASCCSPGTNFLFLRQDTARTTVCACPNSPELVQLAQKVFPCTRGQAGRLLECGLLCRFVL